MRLLILGLLVVALLAGGSRRRHWFGDSDCDWHWRTEARTRAFEARQDARERAREFRDRMRAERERMRREIHEEMRDWRDSH
jgi:hypothetical protein